MNTIEYMNLKKGDKLYFYSDIVGLITYIVQDPKSLLVIEDNNTKSGSFRLVNWSFFYLTADEAKLTFYKDKMYKINKKISKYKKKIAKANTELDELNEEFMYLQYLYPEEFIC